MCNNNFLMEVNSVMFDRNNFFVFLLVIGGIIILGLIVKFLILPQMSSGSSASKSASSFGKLMKSNGPTSIPSKLKWGSDFNNGSKKTKKVNKSKNGENAFSHFKK